MFHYPAFVDGEAGAYGVTFPDLPGIVAMGETVEDALTNAEEGPARLCDGDGAGWGAIRRSEPHPHQQKGATSHRFMLGYPPTEPPDWP